MQPRFPRWINILVSIALVVALAACSVAQVRYPEDFKPQPIISRAYADEAEAPVVWGIYNEDGQLIEWGQGIAADAPNSTGDTEVLILPAPNGQLETPGGLNLGLPEFLGPTSTPEPEPTESPATATPTAQPKATLAPTPTPAPVTTVCKSIYADQGDANCDGKVNILDLVLLQANMDKMDFDRRVDLTRDGQLDIRDFVVIANNYGKGDE
jgi:hypothetical protein